MVSELSRKRTNPFGPSPSSTHGLKRSKPSKPSLLFDGPITPETQRYTGFDIKPDEPAKKQLFPSSNSLPLSPPTTPRKKKSSIYSQVKAIFQRGCKDKSTSRTGYLIGREEEGQDINEFLRHNILGGKCNSLYLTGPPGSGKSEQLELSLNYNQKLFNENQCKLVNINCMTLINPQDIFKQISIQLDLEARGNDDELFETLQKGIDSTHHVIIILDEIDSLLTKNQDILINLFKLSNRNLSKSFTTKCLLIGISNSLDLTNTLLPKLFKYNINPKLVNFKPYNFDKMKSIIVCKLQQFLEVNKENLPPMNDKESIDKESIDKKPIDKDIPIINMSAILLCCKKTASVTGDLRKCFDVIYKSIELIESEYRQNILEYNLLTAPKVSISHVAKVCNINYGNSILTKLTYLQQLILIHLINLENDEDNNSSSPLTINKFYDYWVKQQQQQPGTPIVKKSEFLELLPNLESLSVIRLCTQKNNVIINSNVNYQDFKKSVDNPKLKSLL